MRWKSSQCKGFHFRVCQQDHKTEALLCAKACVLMALQRILENEGSELPFPLSKNAALPEIHQRIQNSVALRKVVAPLWATMEDLMTQFGSEHERVYILNYQGRKGGHYVVAECGGQGSLFICDPWDGEAYFTGDPLKYDGGAGKGSLSQGGILQISRVEG